MRKITKARESTQAALDALKFGAMLQKLNFTRDVIDQYRAAFDQVHLSLKSSGIQAPFWSNSKKYTRTIFKILNLFTICINNRFNHAKYRNYGTKQSWVRVY
jgi:hypothetical protein